MFIPCFIPSRSFHLSSRNLLRSLLLSTLCIPRTLLFVFKHTFSAAYIAFITSTYTSTTSSPNWTMPVMAFTMPTGYIHLEHLGTGGQGTVSKVKRISDEKVRHNALLSRSPFLTPLFAVHQVLAMKTQMIRNRSDISALKKELCVFHHSFLDAKRLIWLLFALGLCFRLPYQRDPPIIATSIHRQRRVDVGGRHEPVYSHIHGGKPHPSTVWISSHDD